MYAPTHPNFSPGPTQKVVLQTGGKESFVVSADLLRSKWLKRQRFLDKEAKERVG